MVLIFNLDESAEDDDASLVHRASPRSRMNNNKDWHDKPFSHRSAYASDDTHLANQGLFSAALACYPVIAQIARDLDLNTLDNLSRTCHLFRALLLANRKTLIAFSLRCTWTIDRAKLDTVEILTGAGYAGQRTRGIPCATDLVDDCQKCDRIVCRNCTAKALPAAKLAKRHRRLCNACATAPLSLLLPSYLTAEKPAFTALAFGKGPCECEESVWLCRPCGQYRPHYDQDYYRVWNWRIRYSTYLGVLGTGIGEGYEGVKCALAEHCLAARKVEVEEDCSSDSSVGAPNESSPKSSSQHSGPEANQIVGYWRQEVEGIGGHLKSKVKKIVVLGQTVQEFEDERETGEYLSREAKGLRRSWCSWCGRIVLGLKDGDALSRAK